MSVTIRARAPLRLGLAGGGTDVSPYCDLFGGFVLNAAIDRFAYAVLREIDEPEIRFLAKDKNEESIIPISGQLVLNGLLDLHKAVYLHMVEHYNGGKRISIELSTFCDAPPGSGLGSSSTLVIAMIRAYVEYFNLPLDDYQIAKIGFKAERVDCAMNGGRQDHYSATFGGFNFMEFYDNDRAVINPLRVKNWIICELEGSLLLFFTGVSRDSAQIISEQSNRVKFGDSTSTSAMHEIKAEALIMKDCLLRGDFSGFVESMRKGWDSKKRTASSVSNSNIDQIYHSALAAGALAGKVSGAGGGGFMLFFVPTEVRMDVVRLLQQFPGQVSNCHFTKYGAQAWRIP